MADCSSKPRIVVSSDHAGFRAKGTIKKYLEGAGYVVDDVGTHSEESVDCPDFARAALAHDSLTSRRARQHNNPNVIALGGKVVGDDDAIAIVQEFLSAKFAGGRHQRRIDKITEMDQVREHTS